MPSRRKNWITWIVAAMAGFICYLAFRPSGWWFAAPAAMGLLYAVLRRVGPWRGYLASLVFSLALFLPMLTWAYNAAGLLPYLALALTSAALLALGGLAYGYARYLLANGRSRSAQKRTAAAKAEGRPAKMVRGGDQTASAALLADALLFALAFTGADTFRQFFPFGGFPWGRLGFTQVDGPMANWAWLGGVPLVGLAAALAGSLAAVVVILAWARGQAKAWEWRMISLAAAFAVVALPLAFPVSAEAQDGTLAIGAVQGDVEVTAEGLFAQQREVLENHVAVSRELAASVGQGNLDVVLWPENSTDIDPRTDAQAYASIDSAAEALGAPVLVGAMQYVNRSNRYNQGLLWRAGLGVVDIYSKRHPAPFAEYMPARSFFRLFTKKVDLINTDMLAGDKVGLMRFDAAVLGRTVALGEVICFEVAYDQVVADVVEAGAEALVVQTNNASFGFSEEATQQFAMTRLRAIEHGRATVQISTVGVSAAVAPDGSLLTPLTSLYEPAYFRADLPLRTSLTPATVIGGVICWALLLVPLALAVAGAGARLVGGRR
jgi:apolipoprotein N-acyltransferase